MYTTLKFLKHCKACVPGYTRMVTFFSLSPKMKDVPIPLWLISLVCGVEDVGWVARNALIVDSQEMDGLKKAYLNGMLRYLYWTNYGTSRGIQYHEPKVNSLTKEAMGAMLELGLGWEKAQAYLDTYRPYNLDHWVWNEVVHQPALNLDAAFILELVANFKGVLGSEEERVLEAKEYPAIRTQRLGYKKPARPSRFGDSDEDSDREDDLDKEPEEKNTYLFGKNYADRKVIPEQEMLARILSMDDNPHALAVEWMAKHSVMEKSKVKGFMLSQASADEPPAYHMTFNSGDSRVIFDMFRLVTAKNADFSAVINATNTLAGQIEEEATIPIVSSQELDEVAMTDRGQIRTREIMERSRRRQDATADESEGPIETTW